MPSGGYLKPFDASQIPGTTQANLIDNTFRDMHSAIIERLDDTIFEDTTDDPLVLKLEVSGQRVSTGTLNSKRLALPHTSWLYTAGDNVSLTSQYILADGAANALYCPVILPPGVTVLEVAIYCKVIGTSAVGTFQFYYIDSSSTAFTVTAVPSGTWNTTLIGSNAIVYCNPNNVIADFYNYAIAAEVTPSNNLHFIYIFGGYIIYDCPSHLYTY
jgi:hypothetical protein